MLLQTLTGVDAAPVSPKDERVVLVGLVANIGEVGVNGELQLKKYCLQPARHGYGPSLRGRQRNEITICRFLARSTSEPSVPVGGVLVTGHYVHIVVRLISNRSTHRWVLTVAQLVN